MGLERKNTRKASVQGEAVSFVYSSGISSGNTFRTTHENIDNCSFYFPSCTEFIVAQSCRACVHRLLCHTSRKYASAFVATVLLLLLFLQSRRHAASCVKDSGKVRSHGQRCENVWLVRREGGRTLWRAGDRRVETL